MQDGKKKKKKKEKDAKESKAVLSCERELDRIDIHRIPWKLIENRISNGQPLGIKRFAEKSGKVNDVKIPLHCTTVNPLQPKP